MSFIPRSTFPYPLRTPSWFAGHMSRSLRELPTLLEDIDLVIEARDARLPLTSINKTFDEMLDKVRNRKGGKGKEREKVVVYTKRDLAERKYEGPLTKAFLEQTGQRVMFADTRSDKDVKEVLKHAVRIANENAETIPDLRVLVVGMPNVGKSSLLNALRRVGVRKGKAFRTGAEAGITRKLTGTVRIHEDPSVYVYDTPGVMMPYLGKGEDGAERGLKLALTAGIKESLFEQDAIADYLLWKMNQRLVLERDLPEGHSDKHPSYLSLLPLPASFEPTDHLPTLLDALCDRLGALKKGGERDHDAGQGWLIRAFREGKLGGWTLDDLGGKARAVGRTSGLAGVTVTEIGDGSVVERVVGVPPLTEDGGSHESTFPPTVREQERAQLPSRDGTATTGPASLQQSSPPATPSGATATATAKPTLTLDARVSQSVAAYLSSLRNSSDTPGTSPSSSVSANQARKANKRQKLEERDTKLRAKGINVATRVWGEGNTLIQKHKIKSGSKFAGPGGLGKGSIKGQAGRIVRSRR